MLAHSLLSVFLRISDIMMKHNWVFHWIKIHAATVYLSRWTAQWCFNTLQNLHFC
jgi:hypothetical protein